MNSNVEPVITTKSKDTKIRAKLKAIAIANLKCFRYAMKTMSLKWQTGHFIRTESCEAVQSNKVWNKKIHGWFRSHFHFKNCLSIVKP